MKGDEGAKVPQIIWTNKARKQLSRIDSRYRETVYNKVGELADLPDVQLDLTKIQGSSDREYRVRIGVYRVIFQVMNGKPVIIEIREVLRRTTNTY